MKNIPKDLYDNYSRQKLVDKIHELESQILDIQAKKEKHSFKETYSSRILDALPDMLTVIANDGTCVEVVSSEKTVHIGNSSDKLINKSIKEFLPPKAYKIIRENMDIVINTGSCSIANHSLEFNGTLHHYENRIFPLDEKNLLCMCRDITEPMKIREELENVKYAVNNALEDIYATDTAGILLFANAQFIKHYNISGQLQKYNICDIDQQHNKEEWHKYVNRIRENGGSLKYTATQQLPNGEIIPVEIVSYIIKDHAENDMIWAFVRNISIRINQENTIRSLNFIMDAILNNVPAYLFVKDPGNEFRYLYWNKAFEEFSHIPAKKAIGHTDAEIFPDPEDAKKFKKDDAELLKNGIKMEFQEQYTTVTGEIRTVKTLKTLVPSENNKLPLIIGISWDITELKNTEKELIAARIKAEDADKLKSAFLANMSHEIRTPMNAIVGFSRLIAETEDAEERQNYINIVEDNANLLLQLINDILDLSKIEAGTLEFVNKPVNLVELCQNIYQIHLPRTPQGVKLVLDENNPEIITASDQNRLRQVISNLLTNAQKFTKQGEICFGFKQLPDNTIEFYVKDSGIGIAKKQAEKIFNRFTQLNNFAQGTGLGLAICRMIIKNLGGKIQVESIENVGSVFKFTIPYLPHHDTTEIEIIPKIIYTKKDMNDKKTILVAEDVDSNFLLLQALIGKTYTLIRAYNGEEAVELFRKEKPDLILMDIKMPKMNGLEATGMIRKEAAQLPIIALTAFAFESDKTEALEAGCSDFLTKPISAVLLKQTIEKYI